MTILESSNNPFKGVIPKPSALPKDPLVFRDSLLSSLQEWTSEGMLTVWLEIPISKANLIPIATEAGFVFHHSNTDYLMMTYQLVADAFIPPFATHYIGAGGVVLNQKSEF